MGQAVATVSQMVTYIKKVNPSVPKSIIDMIPYYISEGSAEGVRGDIAFAQSCLETGNFTFKGSAVTSGQNNFAGMGVTKTGEKGNSFTSAQIGIRAQIQHLKAIVFQKHLHNILSDVVDVALDCRKNNFSLALLCLTRIFQMTFDNLKGGLRCLGAH